jgi:multidrug efflux pump subunit AcrA (membrane-fusion protein)
VESALVVSIGLLVLLGGAVTLMSKQRILPWSLPALRTSGGGPTLVEREPDLALPQALGAEGIVDSAADSPTAVARPTFAPGSQTRRGLEEPLLPPEPVRLDLVASPPETLSTRLALFEERLDRITDLVDRQMADLNQELRRALADLARHAEAEDARRQASLERLRADLLLAVSHATVDGSSRTDSRRLEVTAELYARLARLEAALCAVTNPILLPGEPYAPPAEFLPEALVWENWNEVGERAFSLADTYSAQRLHFSDETRGAVDEFVTKLRMLLTQSVYPNLQPEPDATQQVALRAALEEIAAELPRVREKLDWEYRESRSL